MRSVCLSICAVLLSIGCGADPDEPASAPVRLALDAEHGTHLMLFWQSVLFEDPSAGESSLRDHAPGTLVPLVDGAVDLAVTPNYSLYDGACAHFGPDVCDAELQGLEDRRAYAMAKLLLVDDLEGDGSLDCTLGTIETCEQEMAPRVAAPHHMLLFVDVALDAASDPFLSAWGVEGQVERGVWLVNFQDKQNATLLPLDAEPIVFDGMQTPNVF